VPNVNKPIALDGKNLTIINLADLALPKGHFMWNCSKCKEQCEDNFDSCWSCGTGRDGSAPPPELSESRSKPNTTQSTQQLLVGKRGVISRYSDAYTVAHTITGLGSTIKGIGVIIGLVIALMGFHVADSTQSGQLALEGLILGVIVCIPIYILGILVSTLGQILKATIDTAVHTSPMLTKDDMKKIMSLD